MRLKIWTCILLLIICWYERASAEVTEFRVMQVQQHLPKMTVYLNIRDKNGETIRNLEHIRIDAYVGTEKVSVGDLKPFDPAVEGVSYIFLVDISKSLSITQFSTIKKALSTWVNAMTENDFAAIMTFGSTVRLLQDFTAEKEKLKSTIDTLVLTDKETQLHLGLVRAMELGRRRDTKLPGRRVIIILSDGQDDFAGSITQSEVLNRIKENPVPIYAIGFVKSPMTVEKESSLKILGEFAQTSEGFFFKADHTNLPVIYDRVRKSVLDVWSAELDCKACKADGGLYRLQMNLFEDTKILSDGQDIRMLTIVSEPELAPGENPAEKSHMISLLKKIPLWAYCITVGLLIFILIIVFMKKKKPVLKTNESQEVKPIGKQDYIDGNGTAQPQVFMDTPVPGKSVRLTKVGIKNQVYTCEITDEFIIGRNSACHLVLNEDGDISGRHCKLYLKDDHLYVQDLGSTNGTLINGVPISDIYRLCSGDLLVVGRTELRISFT